MLVLNGSREAVTHAFRAPSTAIALGRPARAAAAQRRSIHDHLLSSSSARAVGSSRTWPVNIRGSTQGSITRQSSSHATSSDPAIRLAQLTLDAQSHSAAQTELDSLDPSSAEYAQRAKALSEQGALQEVWKSWKGYERVSDGVGGRIHISHWRLKSAFTSHSKSKVLRQSSPTRQTPT